MPDIEISPSVASVDKSPAPVKSTPQRGAEGPRYNEDEVLLEGEEEQVSEETPEFKESEEEVKPKTEKSEDKSDDEEELELELEEDKKPNIPFDRPTISEIKAKYPDLFKDFPQLKESYFREIEFTKFFPTAEDAREAFNDNEAFSNLSDAVLSGDPTPLLDSIEKTDKKALEIFSMSFLPTLIKKDAQLYSQVVTPLFQNLVQTLYRDKDENTKNAALVLSEWIFGSDGEQVAKGQKSVAKSIQPTEEQRKIREEKDQRDTTAFRASAGKVQQTIERGLEGLILKSPVFDPDKVFSPSLRKMGAQEVIKRVMAQLMQDQGHMTVMGARWKRAKANGYISDDESKIVSTYLARAKSLIPSIASKVSSAMLGTKTRAAAGKDERTKVFPKQNNSGAAANGRGIPEKKDYSKMSDIDILND
jgi:hypothetical protein